MTDIRLFDRHGDEIKGVSYKDFDNGLNQAYPTSRLLSCDEEDCWAEEEWVNEGVINGMAAEAYYLFDAEDIDGAKTRCPDNPPEEYPWDEEHCARIIIINDEIEIVDGSRASGIV